MTHACVQILGGGQLTKPLRFSAEAFSEVARKGIEQAGGSLEQVRARQGRRQASRDRPPHRRLCTVRQRPAGRSWRQTWLTLASPEPAWQSGMQSLL